MLECAGHEVYYQANPHTPVDVPSGNSRPKKDRSDAASLTVLSGPLAGQTIAIPHGKLLIGREVDCHVRPDSALISRHHCVLLWTNTRCGFATWGAGTGPSSTITASASGETILIDGDTVTVGEMSCHIDLSEELVETQIAPPPRAMEGTAIFEGDTVQPANPNLDSPIPARVALPPTPKVTI